jgi:hypothetical protein
MTPLTARANLLVLNSMKKGVPYVPRGTIKGFLDLYRAGGFLGLYTGFRLHALRDTLVRLVSFPCLLPVHAHILFLPLPTQGTGWYFGMYDSAQHVIANNPDTFSSVPTWVTTFVCGSAGSSFPFLSPPCILTPYLTAGVSSWFAIYPVDLVKAKLQRNALADAPYERPWSIFRRLSAGGVTKLYRGLGISAFRCVKSCIVCRKRQRCANFARFSALLRLQVDRNARSHVYASSCARFLRPKLILLHFTGTILEKTRSSIVTRTDPYRTHELAEA